MDRGTGAGAFHLAAYAYGMRSDALRASEDDTTWAAGGSNPTILHTAWGYDGLARLTAEVKGSPGQSGYDADTYSYDLVGNRLGKLHDAGGPAASTSVAYTYNSDDQPLI